MKLKKAQEIIKASARDGFIVVFYRFYEPGKTVFDFFPEMDESPIKTEDEAWELAKKFAEKTFDYCLDIYVYDENFTPVKEYKKKMIRNNKLSG